MADQPTDGPNARTRTDAGDPPSPGYRPLRRTRVSAVWVGVIVAAGVLVLLLIFILQNTRSVKVSFFTASGNMPLGVALLLAIVGGVLIAGLVASLRIWQLRHRLKAPRHGTHPVDGIDDRQGHLGDTPLAQR